MEQLLYLEEHTSCMQYKPDLNLGFKFHKADEGDVCDILNKDYNYLVFVLEGEVLLNCNDSVGKCIHSGEFFLVPKSAAFFSKALSPLHVLVFSFDSLISVCEKMHFQSYWKICSKLESSLDRLPIRSSVQLFIELLKRYLNDNMSCEHLHRIKHQELFLLLRGYYSKEELAGFFRPIIGKDLDFKNFVQENCIKVKTLEELIHLSGMGKTSFNIKFKEEFGMSAYQWLLKQKAKHIKFQLAEPGITLTDIMFKFNFSSPSQLTRFCKQQFGCTPTELRQQLEIND